ncbi:bifunctional DNA-formamidopyrimidine glycosylase/DNA-(apurinic or apyrimidinic site) lyase [Halovulum sp. GXIMD14793]
MPELPEVETVRRGLDPVLTGKVIARAIVRRPDLRWPFPENMAKRLTGQTVLRLRRRSKYILADLSSDETLLVHLGMSGRLLLHAPRDVVETGRHDHVELQTETGARVVFNDPRRFGAMDLLPTQTAGAHRLLASLGPEPLGNDFNETTLAERLKGRRTPIKSALLDQRNVAGLGNIYVCEALWRAGISPKRLAGDISAARIAELVPHIRETLLDAITAGGSSLRDYRQADGELGYFQHAFRAYGREGEPCLREGCGGTIKRIVQSGRSTFYCPKCQR